MRTYPDQKVRLLGGEEEGVGEGGSKGIAGDTRSIGSVGCVVVQCVIGVHVCLFCMDLFMSVFVCVRFCLFWVVVDKTVK